MGDAGDGAVCMGSALRWSRDAFLDSVGVDVALLFCWLVFFVILSSYGWSREGGLEHTLLVIGAAIDRAAKATAAKNVDFMLMDLSDEAEKRGLMLLYVFKQEETCRAYWKCFFHKEKKNSTLPIPLMQKPPPACSEVTNAEFLASFRWHVRVLPLCSFSSRHAHHSSNIGGHCHGSTKVR